MIGIILIAILFGIGLWGVVAQTHLVKKIISLGIINSTVIILFIYFASQRGSTAPILLGQEAEIVDPVPQALMLTAIVIGIALTALALVLAYRIYRKFHSLDIQDISKQLDGEVDG